MYKINCLNPIAAIGMNIFTDAYEMTENFADAQVAMVRSAAMHDMELPESLLAVARAGAGVNNIPLDKCAEKGIVVFNTPGANANGVKELVIAGLFMATRNVVAGANWVTENKGDENISKTMEKAKKAFATIAPMAPKPITPLFLPRISVPAKAFLPVQKSSVKRLVLSVWEPLVQWWQMPVMPLVWLLPDTTRS